MNKNKIKIFDIDYLINEELTEDDLHELFDEKSLKYSLIVGMFRHIGEINRSDSDILNICKTNKRWYNKYNWTKKQRDAYCDLIIKVYKNVYQYSDIKSSQLAQWWLILYGFNVKKSNFFES